MTLITSPKTTSADQALELILHREPVTTAALLSDYTQLSTLCEAKMFDKKDKHKIIVLKEVTAKILTSIAGDQKRFVHTHRDRKRQFLSLALTVFRPEDITTDEDRKLIKDAIDFIVMKNSFSSHQSTGHQIRRKIIGAATNKPGALYYYLEQQRVLGEGLSQLVSSFRWCVNLKRLNGARNLLYIMSEVPKCTLAHIISSSFDESIMGITFAMIEIGIFCYHNNCVCDDRPTNEKFDLLISKIKMQPLSLQQLARLVVRKTMKDVDLVTDSYKLPIPKLLQRYVNLRFLNASIAGMYFDNYEPEKYDIVSVINGRYGMDFDQSVISQQNRRSHWSVEDDFEHED